MTRDNSTPGRITVFFTRTLWEMNPADYRGVRGRLVRYLQIAALVVRDFWDDQCLLRASALAFTTILSIVPFFALAFAVLKGLGVQNRLEPFLLTQLAGGYDEIVNRIITYINNTKMASVGVIGLIALVVTVISLLGNVEDAFNSIWGVKETRSLFRKFSDYISVVVSTPILAFAAISITTSLESQEVVQWLINATYFGDLLVSFIHLIPYLSVWLALTLLYVFIPNTKVRVKSALVGGVLAGTGWQVAQWFYVHFQVGVARYNAIYGTLALLPIFMIWIYTSWLIILFGVEVVYAHQHIRTFRREVRVPFVSHAAREKLTLAILMEIAIAFVSERSPWTVEDLAERLDVPERVVKELLDLLVVLQMVAPAAGEPVRYLPARELHHIVIRDLFASLRHHGKPCWGEHLCREFLVVERLMERCERERDSLTEGLTLKDLVGEYFALVAEPGGAQPDCSRDLFQVEKGGE